MASLGSDGSCCLQGASLGALPHVCLFSPWEEKPPRPLIRAGLELVEPMNHRGVTCGGQAGVPGSSPGIPRGWGSCGQCPSPGFVPRGLRALLSDSRWPPVSLGWVLGNTEAPPGPVPRVVPSAGGTAGDGCRGGFLCQVPWVWMPSGQGPSCRKAPGTGGCWWRFRARILLWAKGRLPTSLIFGTPVS